MTLFTFTQIMIVVLCMFGFVQHTVLLARKDGVTDILEFDLWLRCYRSSKEDVITAYKTAIYRYQHPTQVQKEHGWTDEEAEYAQDFTQRSIKIIKAYCERNQININDR